MFSKKVGVILFLKLLFGCPIANKSDVNPCIVMSLVMMFSRNCRKYLDKHCGSKSASLEITQSWL